MSTPEPTVREGTKRPVRRRALQPTSLVWLTAVWMMLWGELSVWTLVSGLGVAVLASLAFPLPPVRLGSRVRPLRLIVLVVTFLLDVVRASVQVAGIVLRPRPVRNSIVAVRLRNHSDFVLTGVAAMLSLVPGSIVVEARRSTHTLYLHVLDAHTPDQIDHFRHRAAIVEDRFVAAFQQEPEVEHEPGPGPEPRSGPATTTGREEG